MARKEEQGNVEDDEGQGVEEEEEVGISINITDDAITIDLPRDGNEGETLGQLAKMVEALGQ